MKITEIEDVDLNEFIYEFLEIENALLTKDSLLSDFCGRGLSSSQIDSADSYNALCSLWDEFILNKFNQTYGCSLDSTNVTIRSIVEKIYKKEAFINF